MKGILGLCLVLVLLLWGSEAQAALLAERLAQFPDWGSKPPVTAAQGDLIYPDWMEGTWRVTSTLVEQVAPLAPQVVTPGFEGNSRYLNQPVSFLVRFQAVNDLLMPLTSDAPTIISDRFLPLKPQGGYKGITPGNSERVQVYGSDETSAVVADRVFNGLNIATAYLGDHSVQSVKVDPESPNRQITFLSQGRQLISIVTGRATETPAPNYFIATEVSNQIFRGTSQPYFNQVETTTAYKRLESSELAIEADQVTAIYLSPQDPNYFKALDRPVALYRYRLELEPIEP